MLTHTYHSFLVCSDFSKVHGEINILEDVRWQGFYLIWSRYPTRPLGRMELHEWCKSAQKGAKQRPGGDILTFKYLYILTNTYYYCHILPHVIYLQFLTNTYRTYLQFLTIL